MEDREEINKNLLKNVDYAKGESKSVVTSFLITKCSKCGNEIKYRIAINDIKNVEQYIDQLKQENKKLNKMIDEMIDEYELYGRYNLKEFCDEKIRENKCIKYCLECIKQYFEEKVEGKLNDNSTSN